MKVNNFQGSLTDISAKKEALLRTLAKKYCISVEHTRSWLDQQHGLLQNQTYHYKYKATGKLTHSESLADDSVLNRFTDKTQFVLSCSRVAETVATFL